MADDFITDLCERVKDHAARKAPLRIRGGGTKDFYGAPPARASRSTIAGYAGIVAYEPRELVLTVKAGTRLADIDAALAARGPDARLRAAALRRGGHHRRHGGVQPLRAAPALRRGRARLRPRARAS